jgi:ribosome-associated protein
MTARKTARKTAGKPVRKPVRKPAAKPAGKLAAKPASKTAPKPANRPAKAKKVVTPRLAELVTAALDDLKAQNVAVLDVSSLTDVTDTIVIASGTSDRHVKSLAGRVLERAKEAGFRSIGVEGEREGEWVLVDLQDVIVHVMLPRIREFYALEKLWDVRPGVRAAGP